MVVLDLMPKWKPRDEGAAGLWMWMWRRRGEGAVGMCRRRGEGVVGVVGAMMIPGDE